MIVANMATYPARAAGLRDAIGSLLPHVDQLNLILNEYLEVPRDISGNSKINAIIPAENTMDTGKFLVRADNAKYLFLVDDDIIYPVDYVSNSISSFESLGEVRAVGGYHASIYMKPSLALTRMSLKRYINFNFRRHLIGTFRQIYAGHHKLDFPTYVDQLGTGTLILRGRDLPHYSDMRTSRRFVDVRLARICHERSIPLVALPRPENWLNFEDDDISIARTFTQKNPPEVAAEIQQFAFRNAAVGTLAGKLGYQGNQRDLRPAN